MNFDHWRVVDSKLLQKQNEGDLKPPVVNQKLKLLLETSGGSASMTKEPANRNKSNNANG